MPFLGLSSYSALPTRRVLVFASKTSNLFNSIGDGELWAIARHTAWEIDGDGRGTLRWNFYSANKDSYIDGTEFTYDIRNKNTILILQIAPKRFSEALWNPRYFTLVMPGNLQNLSVSFVRKGSSMLDALAECVAKNENTYKNVKPALEKIRIAAGMAIVSTFVQGDPLQGMASAEPFNALA